MLKANGQSLCVLAWAAWAGLAWSAGPSFDAGALLEQINRQSAPRPVGAPPAASQQPTEVLGDFEFRELPDPLVPVATAFLRRHVGKPVRMDSLLLELYAHLQQRNPADNYIFVARKLADRHVLVAQKVVFDGVTIAANGTRASDAFLAGLMGHGLQPGAPLNYAQISRNATVVSELPGIASRFRMQPGAAPGSSSVHLSSDPGAWVAGSASADNSGARSLGAWTTRADVAVYNPFGRAELLRLNGQLTQHSQSAGLDASATVHPSGLRAGLNLSTFHYGFHTEADGMLAGNPQYTRSHFTGVSSSSSLNLTYPQLRTEEARQNLTLDLHHNTSVSDAEITQQTRILGTVPEQVNEARADYRLSDLLIRKATLGINGARAQAGGATFSYQLGLVLGHVQQRVASAATQDAGTERALGRFGKAQVSVQRSQRLNWGGQAIDGLLVGELQLSDGNLPGPEKAYLGGLFRMQGWAPQAVGGQQVAYLRVQATRPVPDAPGAAVGAFAEVAAVQLSRHAYTASMGAQTYAVGTGWQNLSNVGLQLTYTPRSHISWTAAVAKKISRDPIVNGARLQDEGSVRGWISARLTF